MKGIVDESLRALLKLPVRATDAGAEQELTVWLDTAFNGSLAIPRQQIHQLALKQASTTQAILANGQAVDLETFTCYLSWFGNQYRTQVVANDGDCALLGTMLLADRKLTIDYPERTVLLE